MGKYDELVEALRDGCDWTDVSDCMRYEELMHDAAAAIEALQAEVKRLELDNEDYEYTLRERYDEPKRGKWTWIQRANGGHYKGCSVCHAPMPTDSMLDYLDDEDCKFCYSCGAKMEVQDGQ